jgi:hypothetical protein
MKRLIIFLFLVVFTFASYSQLQNSGLTESSIQSTPAEANSNSIIDKIVSIVSTVDGNNNFVDQISPDSTAALPFGILKQIGAARYIIAIDSMKFKPQGAYFSAYAAIDVPGTTKKLAPANRATHDAAIKAFDGLCFIIDNLKLWSKGSG